MDTVCKCKTCGREENVSFAQCVMQGWPHCCHQRMEVKETTVDIESVVAQILAPLDNIIEQAAQKQR